MYARCDVPMYVRVCREDIETESGLYMRGRLNKAMYTDVCL